MLIEYPITKIEFIRGIIPDTQKKGVDSKRFKYYTSGTYTSDHGVTSAGPLMIGGNLFEAGDEKTWHRGGVAVMANGEIKVLRLDVVNTPANAKTDVADEIRKRTHPPRPQPAPQPPGTPGPMVVVNVLARVAGTVVGATRHALQQLNGVTDFMGGGALVIEGGNFVPDSDLATVQQFENGYDSLQLNRATFRTAVGQKSNGNVYFIITDELPSALAKRLAGTYQNFVFFDGGNGFWAHDYTVTPSKRFGVGLNGVGIGVR